MKLEICLLYTSPFGAWSVDSAFKYRPTPALLNPVFPIIPASVTIKMVGLPFFCVIFIIIMDSLWLVFQSQLWARNASPPVPASLLIPMEVQPPSALSSSFPTNTSSLLQFKARISSKSSPDPSATPRISSR